MKKLFIILGVVFASMLAVSATVAPKENHEHPQEYVQVRCPVCNGYKVVIVGVDAWGNPVHELCKTCGGTGIVQKKVQSNNPSFRGGESYYAECGHSGCNCTFYVPERKGSTKCKCGHSKFDHVKRYYKAR